LRTREARSERFRQLGSKCPGHPEYRWTSGVEATTGPLGQGVATSVGMAIAARWLARRYNRAGHELFGYSVYAMCSDGDLRVAIAANKLSGIYAGVCHDTYSAHQGVEHDAMNVLALGARVVGEALALELLRAFLDACPSDEERHRRRIAKTRAIEARAAGGQT
jgi:Transketolase, thiamine diphosphate binding domain/Ribose/Galactose Isomerase